MLSRRLFVGSVGVALTGLAPGPSPASPLSPASPTFVPAYRIVQSGEVTWTLPRTPPPGLQSLIVTTTGTRPTVIEGAGGPIQLAEGEQVMLSPKFDEGGFAGWARVG